MNRRSFLKACGGLMLGAEALKGAGPLQGQGARTFLKASAAPKRSVHWNGRYTAELALIYETAGVWLIVRDWTGEQVWRSAHKYPRRRYVTAGVYQTEWGTVRAELFESDFACSPEDNIAL